MRFQTLVLILVVLSLGTVGCGGDDQAKTVTETVATPATDSEDQAAPSEEELDALEEEADQATQDSYDAAAEMGLTQNGVKIAEMCVIQASQGSLTPSQERRLERLVSVVLRAARNYPEAFAKQKASIIDTLLPCAPDLATRVSDAG